MSPISVSSRYRNKTFVNVTNEQTSIHYSLFDLSDSMESSVNDLDVSCGSQCLTCSSNS